MRVRAFISWVFIPSAGLVIVHRVDTEVDSQFETSFLYRLFGAFFGG
ncbi:MAG: hypothetical protein V2J19_06645 [Wenzhouxiangella sp.]|jgi:hypothetical protein|nr:hypothetical protein [Wenzhouxiangella sp.]